MKKIIAITIALATLAVPAQAAPTKDFLIIVDRICPMFDRGMTSGEVVAMTKIAMETNARSKTPRPAYSSDPYFRSLDRTLDETYRTLASSAVETAVGAYCPQYSDLLK
ncbi:MAG: hypothetical protein ACRCZS_23780 [Chroococcidiopsis sp.]